MRSAPGSRQTEGAVCGIVLAAGASRRFARPRPKQLALFRGEALVRRAVRQALSAGLEPVVVVLGYAAEAVEAALGDLAVVRVLNPRFEEGQSTSVKAGLAKVPAEAAGALFVPVDQPALSAEVLAQLVERFRQTGGPVVVPTHGGRRGAPALFARELFAELAGIEGDEGGRQVLRRRSHAVVEVPLESPLPLEDIDTKEDLERLARSLEEIE